MDAVLRPNRSLSPAAFRLTMLCLIGVCVALAGVFAAFGAYPVVGFLGLDILLVYGALKLSYRSGRVSERVRVAFDRVLVSRSGAGRERHWMASPLWVRVDAAEDAVRLAAGGRHLRIGAFLSPPERESFAEALRADLSRAKRGPAAGP